MNRADLEKKVAALHAAHYTPEHPHGLLRFDQSPNENTIYKVWNDGEITNEKGGEAYGDRRMRSSAPPLVHGVVVDLPRFPVEGPSGENSYAMLTYEECREVRADLFELLKPYMVSHAEVRVRTDSEDVVRTLRASFRELGLTIEHQSPVVVCPYVFVVLGRGDVAHTVRRGLGGMDADIYVY